MCYASRSLTDSERNYAQIEKELLAILFGCRKFHQYLYSKPVLVESDHKPLEYLFRKPLTAAPPRLQRMMLALQKYDLHVTYKPGKKLFIADTLSRSPGPDKSPETQDEFEVNTVKSLPISEHKIEQFHTETQNDPVLQRLQETVNKGWPTEKSSLDPLLAPYWDIRDEVNIQEGLLLRNERLIVPTSLRKEMLEKLHGSHLGIEKCKLRARDVLYWPGMNDHLAQYVASCETCQTFRNAQQKEPLKSHPVPDRPWQKVGMDLFDFESKDYLVIGDYFSKYFEISQLSSTTSPATIKHIKPVFARFGIPEEVISDNGPQFDSSEFKKFANTYNFKHTTSSPKYPQSNGFIERAVQTAKQILRKAMQDNSDPNIALLDYRNTPIQSIGLSPVQLLMGRRTRTLLPTNPKLLEPLYNVKNVKAGFEEIQRKQKIIYDRGARKLDPLTTGEQVRMRNDNYKMWQPAVVKQVSPNPRSYVVESRGREYRRNRKHLLRAPQFSKPAHKPEVPAVTDSLSTTNTTIQEPNTTTRSGRAVRPLVRLSDYVT